jgi:ATP-dependent DNA helicase RecG
MHPTIRVFMDRIEFQNPGGFIVPVNRVLEEAISLPRNPIIIKLFRFAKLSENAGYGIDKMKTWTALTGKNVGFRSDVTHATVTYFKKSPFVAAYASEPTNFYINDPISDPVNQNNPKNDPINELISQNDPINEPINQNDPVSDPIKNTETIIKILGGLIENPQIKYEDLQITANCSRATIRRTLKKLREVGIIIREGSRKTGHWIVTENGQKILKSQKR